MLSDRKYSACVVYGLECSSSTNATNTRLELDGKKQSFIRKLKL